MAETSASLKLTHEGALAALNAGIAKATAMGQPQCISVVDTGGHLLAFVRMDGAFHMSLETSLRKAKTAACYGAPTGGMQDDVAIKLALGTDGQRINLPGGRRGVRLGRPGPRGRDRGDRRHPGQPDILTRRRPGRI